MILITLALPDSELIAQDFTEEERRTFTITREILFESEDESVIRQKGSRTELDNIDRMIQR